ncbi:hypothetical protein LXA43DRAFT_1063378 [Ganoderma leucocontextum]|nr:hypothetical protein LXA43DRAFT_1063378 [Ganoderma leucocontextum]
MYLYDILYVQSTIMCTGTVISSGHCAGISTSYASGDRENDGHNEFICTPSFDNVLEWDAEPGANHNVPEHIETIAILSTKRVSTKKPQDKGTDMKSVQHQLSPTRSNSVASSGPLSLISVSDTESIDDSNKTTIPHMVMVKFTNKKIKQLFFKAMAEPFGNKSSRTLWKTDFANAISRAVGKAVEEAICPMVSEMKKARRDMNINHVRAQDVMEWVCADLSGIRDDVTRVTDHLCGHNSGNCCFSS